MPKLRPRYWEAIGWGLMEGSQEMVQLLRHPESAAFYTLHQVAKAGAPLAQQLDSNWAAMEAFDRVGRPAPELSAIAASVLATS